ncbi:MAG: hypothetical protein IAI50_00385 [Candidatus Eremiobacteraeota bacterium]|nr:hypothetical protein [Candidatus Eremiobacteraeota bacterium]
MKPILQLCAAVAVAWSLGAVPAKASTSFPAVGHGDAYAAVVELEAGGTTKVLSGPIAPAMLACNVTTATNTNDANAIAFPGVLTTGTATDTVQSMHSTSGASIQSTSSVQGVSALGGLITATTVEAVANSVASSAGASSNGNGSTFVNLVVAGNPINGTPAPNTTIALAGIGTVELNEQLKKGDASKTSIEVNLIHIRVTVANTFGLKVGTNIIVAHAVSGLNVSASPTSVDASSYGLLYKAGVGNDISVSGDRYAPATLSCMAGDDTNRIAGVSSPIGNLGAIVDTAKGVVTASGGMATGKSDIQNTNLLGGLIVASAIQSLSEAQVTTTGARMGATTLVGASIAGVKLKVHPLPNTRIDIAGLGYAILNEQSGSMSGTSAKQEVNAIHVFVTVVNSFKLPINSTIVLGHSQAGVVAF